MLFSRFAKYDNKCLENIKDVIFMTYLFSKLFFFKGGREENDTFNKYLIKILLLSHNSVTINAIRNIY